MAAALLIGCTSAPERQTEREYSVRREAAVTPAIAVLNPVDLAYPQVRPNRLTSDVLYVRDDSLEYSNEHVALSVVIDAQGRVVDAQPIEGLERYFDSAASLMLDQQYEPLVRDGKPVPARFDEYVLVLPAERPHRRRVTFPQGELDGVIIRLKRGVCMGSCPIYEVSIHGNGMVTFDGQHYVAVERQLKYQVPKADVAGLLDLFKAVDFFSLDERYQADVTDIPGYRVSLEYGGMTKSVIDYMGYAVGMPVGVIQLEEEIDRVAGTDRWLILQPATLTGLREMGITPEPDKLAAALACTADSLSDDEILALLRLGVPADGACPRPFDRDASTINLVAKEGRAAMVRALLEHGALKNASAEEKSQLLCSAIVSKNLDLVRVALQFRPNLEIACSFSLSTPLALASSSIALNSSARDMVQLLAEAGADLQHRDQLGYMAIHHQYNMAGVEALMAIGADINAQTRDGRTLLLETQSEDLAVALIDIGADTTGTDDRGRTLAERARANKWDKVLEALDRRGVTPRSP